MTLVGRSVLSREKREKIQSIEESGGEVLYLRGDITNVHDMQEIVRETKLRFGTIHGVIHSALNLTDGLIEKMSEQIFRQGLAPKYKGSFALHHATLPAQKRPAAALC